MNIKPLGYFVLVDVTQAEEITSGGIVLPDSLVEKEQAIEQTGTVIAIGPTAYVGMRGCETEGTDKTPADLWGVKVGDKVEFRKYEGKNCFVKGKENLRYIPDTHIMGVIEHD